MKTFDFKEIETLFDNICKQWAWEKMTKKYWAKDNLKKWRLYYEFSTGGLSDNENMINELPEFVKIICELKWQRGGHHVYDLSPYNFSYKLVNEKTDELKVSRQYIYHNPDKFDWVEVSKNVKFIRKVKA